MGNLGEDSVCNHLRRNGYKVVERNYLKKWGEIDIIAEKDNIIHFYEVKTVSREIVDIGKASVTHETWRPEDNINNLKLKKLHRAIQTWIGENEYGGDWQINAIIVALDRNSLRGTIKIIEDVV